MKKLAKRIYNPGNYPVHVSVSLLFLRVVAGAFMLTHGYGKVLRLFGDDPIKFADPLGIGVTASLALAAFAEFLCSILLIPGVATRLAVIPLIINMSVISFIVHAPDPFSRKELPLLYLSIYLVIAILGAGKYSFDNLIYRKGK